MLEKFQDGTVDWIGGMDTSRTPSKIFDNQYFKGVNVIIPSAGGGIKNRFGMHCASLVFDSGDTRDIYTYGVVQGEGYFESNGVTYAIVVVDGFILRISKRNHLRYYVENLNYGRQNNPNYKNSWVITVPNGCIVNNGFDYGLYVTATQARRLDPSQQEMGIGRMGVYLQNRLFMVDQSGRRILASDFLQPTKFTLEDTNIFGFGCPDEDEVITAIGKQKSILNNAEGGNLAWSSAKDIYSADVRGTRSDWANLGTRVGKTTETVPGFSACSSYSFESFNANIYFRSKQYGFCDIRQSEYQFNALDASNNQAVEASYFFDNDTDWMLERCYTRACNSRLYTTVSPQLSKDSGVYWNGILSMHPAAAYVNQGTLPRRFESVFTGVRPWCLTVVKNPSYRDQMIIHSHDRDGKNRMYIMDEESDYDLNHDGQVVEIKGFIETRAFDFKNPFSLKGSEHRLYKLGPLERTTRINVFARPQSYGEWLEIWDTKHLIGRTKLENGVLVPQNHKPQTRFRVTMPNESFGRCNPSGNSFLEIQYRIEFEGPMILDAFIVVANQQTFETATTNHEEEEITLVYSYRPDYYYSIPYYVQ